MSLAIEYKNELGTGLRAGQVLDGKYRVDYLVGQGGMAAVWAGTNERTGKHVALKMLLPSLVATPGAHSLFQREGIAASRVNHPNVVTVFDVIEHEGAACIVMELLTGKSLDRHLAGSAPLDAKDACGLLLPAMRGVSAAHAQGVIHRDLKPQNIFVCLDPDGRPVSTKVLDFGISIIVERVREPSGQTTNVLMGTPAYMAPEQIFDFAPIDERTDVYGFGVLFYESLTGRVPFLGEPDPALYERILYDPVPPLGQFRPDLSLGLVRAIEKALAKEPAERHTSLALMVSSLEHELVAGTPAAGVPMVVTGHPSGSLAIAEPASRRTPAEPLPRRKPSGEHQATRFLVNFPLEAEGVRRVEPKLAHRDRLDVHGKDSPGELTSVLAAARLPSRAFRFLRSRRTQVGTSVGLLLVAGVAFAWWNLGSNGEAQAQAVPPTPTTPNKPVVEMLAPGPSAENEANSRWRSRALPGEAIAREGLGAAPRVPRVPGDSLIVAPAAPTAQSPLGEQTGVEGDVTGSVSKRGPKSLAVRRLDTRASSRRSLVPAPPGRRDASPSTAGLRAGSLSADDF